MSTNKFNTPLVSGLLAALLIFIAGLTGLALEKPAGSISGRVSLEQAGFHLQSYDMRGNRVYVLAVGPRGGNLVERGVWVNPDGTFRLTQLPVGEYSLRVRAPGFATANKEGVFVDDAKVSQVKALSLAILDPSVNIATNSRVFTSREIPHFWLNATGSVSATVRVYKKDILQLMAHKPDGLEFSSDLNIYKPYQAAQARLFTKDKPLETLNRKLTQDNEDWSRADFKLNHPLPAGEYVAVAEVANLKGKKDWNLMWFSVSDLGLIIKQAPEKTVVRAIDLNTLQPVAGAKIQLMDKGSPTGGTLASGQSGADGFAEFPIPASRRKSDSYNLLALGTAGVNRAFGGIDYWFSGADNYQTYFYTERPVYRLGQTVYFKAIVRKQTSEGLVNPKAGLGTHVVIEDPDNNKLWEGRMTTNAHGTMNGTWAIPADAKTGAYQVTFNYPDGTASYQRFEVAQYRKPEYQVEVQPLDSRITAGGRGKARIRATYYFGAPVANARIKYSVYAATDWSGRYRLMPRPDFYGYYDDWSDDDDTDHYEDQSYAGDYISEGYAQTDASGEAMVEFDTHALTPPDQDPYTDSYEDQRYTIQAEVTDLSRMTVVGSGTESVTAGNFAVFVQPKAEVTRSGEPVQAVVNAVDYTGKPVANRQVSIALTRWLWDSTKEEYRGSETLKTVSVTTDAQGQASVTLPTEGRWFTDNYILSARTQDNQGHAIYDQHSVWIAGENSPYLGNDQAARAQAFSIKLDKSAYKPGETARAIITAPLTGREHAQVIVAVEGAKLHEYHTVTMDAGAKLVEIPLRGDYAPNVYLTATLVAPKHQYYHQETMLKVSPEAHFINLSVSSDKVRYKPGEQAVYMVKATYPDGKPASDTEVSLGVVDESIYAIRPDPAQDIRKFFYAKRYNAVSTLSSFPEEYSGGPDKIEPRLRKDFRDMVAWLPTLTTNAQGIAKTTVKLPDNLTTWRATARAINMQSDVGSALSKVLATQDLIVRLALPRFYTQYDEARLTAIVHNYTDKTQHVTLTLNPSSQFDTREALVQAVDVAPDQAVRHEWPVSVTQPGQGTVRIKAVGQTDGDALELSVPIRPLGIEATQAAGGILTADPAGVRIPLNLPGGVIPGQAQLALSIAPSSIGPVLGNFDALIDYPYGCTEQTMSRLFPALIALQLNQKLGVPITAAQSARFHDVMVKGLAKLKEAHNADGGWGWWHYDESSPYLTAYVMEGFALMREAHAAPSADLLPDNWEKDGLAYLSNKSHMLAKQLQDPKLASNRSTQIDALIDLSYMQAVLSLYDRKVSPTVQRALLAKSSWAPPEALAYQTLAFQRSGDAAAAQQSYQALLRLGDPADGMLNWDHTQHLQKLLKTPDVDYTYRFTGVEATALGLRAAVAMENPAGNTTAENRLEAIERWLILQRGASNSPDGWDNTKTTAQVLRAMMGKAIALGKPADTNLTVTSNLWKEALHLTAEDLYRPEQVTRTNASAVAGSVLELSKQGPGRLYYNSLLSFLWPLKPGDAVQQQALPGGLSLRREFYRIHAEPVGPEGTMRFKTEALSGNAIRAGETVLMKVVVDTPVALPYVLIDAALPSGGEVLSDDPRENSLDSEDSQNSDMNGDWGSWWWAHQDILDDQVVMFATSVPAGKSEFHALVRMEMPGTFQMNPVKLEGMYSKRIRAFSALDQLKVTE